MEEEKKAFRNRAADLWNKAKSGVVNKIDQDNDGNFDLKDVSLIAKRLGNAAQSAADSVRETAKEKGEQFAEKQAERKRQIEYKSLHPLFEDDVCGADFMLSKLIRISEMDKKHRESKICDGSVGDISDKTDMSVITIYPGNTELFELSFYPDKDSEFYYVDPMDRDHYIAISKYYDYLKLA